MMHFLFPCDPFNVRSCDLMFFEQRFALDEAGFATSLVSDSVLEEGAPVRAIPEASTVIYRGWMLSPSRYEALEPAVTAARATLLTSADQYRLTHYLPNWYPPLAEFTPETHVFDTDDDLVTRMRELGWQRFFVKDYVKSLKTSTGSIVEDPAAITSLLAEMVRYRGEIEGGVCVRRVEEFMPETERRFFVIRGQPYGSEEGVVIPEVVWEAARRIESPFFSVDVVERRDGVLRIVEIGDGQVSDLVGWSADRFADIWRTVSA